MKSIGIIGAGMAGLTAALDLVKQGNNVTIYEASDQVGGLSSGFKDPQWDWSVEKYYHHWFASDRHILGLIEELGWSDRVLFPRPYTVMYFKEKWYPLDSVSSALLFPGLGWGINKIRFGLAVLYLRLTNHWEPLEKSTAETWMRKWAGNQVYETMWKPMIDGKFGEKYAEQVNMAWMWARFHARTNRLGTYKGGFQAFNNDMANHLRSLGVEIKLNSTVERITINPKGGFSLRTQQGAHNYDRVLVTTSPAIFAKITPQLPNEYLQGLLSLTSMGAVAMTLAIKHQLSEKGYYWFNLPKQAGFPFLALVEHTNYLSPDYFGGDHIIYCGDYLEPDHEYFQLSKDELLERFLPALKRINPKFERNWIRKVWLHRAKYAQPVPLLNQSKIIPPIQTPLDGLYFASMSQVYPWDRGTNFAVEIARKAVKLIQAK